MSGRLVELTLRSLDRLAVLLRVNASVTEHPAHLRTGDQGEEMAYFQLRKMGYTMVARRFRSPRTRGDIDLVGWDRDTLCFVEVKTRTTRDVKPPEAAVDQDKRQQIGRVAQEYLRGLSTTPSFRFDLITVQLENAGTPEITLFKSFMALP